MDRAVALRADPEHFAAGVIGHEMPGQIAGTDDGVVGIVGNFKLAQLPLHRVGGPRRVGNQDDGAAALAKMMQRLAGFGERHQPVVNHAPDIGEHDIDAADEVAQLLDETK